MANTLTINGMPSTFMLFPSEPARMQPKRSLAFASFTERERRYLTPLNLFSMRKKKLDARTASMAHG